MQEWQAAKRSGHAKKLTRAEKIAAQTKQVAEVLRQVGSDSRVVGNYLLSWPVFDWKSHVSHLYGRGPCQDISRGDGTRWGHRP